MNWLLYWGAQGGMIAQHLTLDFPEKVKKLVLAVMADQSTSLLEKRVKNWLLLAREGIIQNRCWI